MHFVGCEDLFEYFTVDELVKIGQTCKRLNWVVGCFLLQNYPNLSYECYGNGIQIDKILLDVVTGNGLPFFHPFIGRISVREKETLQYLHKFEYKFLRIKQMEYWMSELSECERESWKATFAQLQSLILWNSPALDSDLFNWFLATCQNLKHLAIHILPKRPFAFVNEKEWVRRKYPTLEHFELEAQIRDNSISVEEIKRFLEINPNIQKLTIDADLMSSDSWVGAEVKLDELELKDITLVDEIFWLRLNTLYGQSFYKRLTLEFPEWNQSISLNSINGLLNVCLDREQDTADIELPNNLEALYIDRVDQIRDSASLPSGLTKLRRLRLNIASSDQILPFIRQAVGIKSIWVRELLAGSHFNTDTNIIDLIALNSEREKIEKAQKVTIYVGEKVYVATKWAFGDIDLSLIMLKRIHALDSVHDWYK